MGIAILGTGGVGRTLAAKLIEDGHQVFIGTREVAKTMARTEPDAVGNPSFSKWLADNPKVKLKNFAEAAAFGEVVFLTTHGMAATNAIDRAGKKNFSGKVVVDVTNPLDASQGIENAYWLETNAMLWIMYAFKNNSWNHAFKFLRK